MYTPKGDLNDKLMEALDKEGVMDQVAQAKSIEEAYEIVSKEAPGITMDEFKNSMAVMKAYMDEEQSGVLSEDELDQVAGGKNVTTKSIESGFQSVSSWVRKYSPVGVILSFL